MANYINKYTNIEAYNADDGKQYPNVSYLVATDELKYSNPIVYATFDVTSSTKINVTYNPAAFAKIELDGQEIELVDTNNYDFGTKGKYTLKYTLANETEIPDKSWGWCYELIDMSNIPNTITTIGYAAFLGCQFSDFIIPNSITTIGDSAFSGCNKLTNVTIGNSVTSIDSSAFNNCSSLRSVTIPNSVTTIGDNAFEYCRGLTSLTIGNGVTSIGSSAFYNCSGLTSVTIGNGVTSISDESFKHCSSLTSVTILATTPPTLANTSAFNDTNNCPIYVPAESVDAYKAATNWSNLASRIQAIPTE